MKKFLSTYLFLAIWFGLFILFMLLAMILNSKPFLYIALGDLILGAIISCIDWINYKRGKYDEEEQQ